MTMADGNRTNDNSAAQAGTAPYLEQANAWARDRLDLAERRAKVAYVIAGVAGVLAIAGVVAVCLLAPLKSVEGYLVVVDKSTGQTEVITDLQKGASQVQSLTEESAVSKANLAQYVIARETFDMNDLEPRHDAVRRTSEKKLFDEYDRAFYAVGDANPFKQYKGAVRSVEIKSVEFFNERTGQVRFTTHLKKDGATTDAHWVAIIQYRYVQIPTELKDRLANPLGFQVMSYRVDQESIQ